MPKEVSRTQQPSRKPPQKMTDEELVEAVIAARRNAIITALGEKTILKGMEKAGLNNFLNIFEAYDNSSKEISSHPEKYHEFTALHEQVTSRGLSVEVYNRGHTLLRELKVNQFSFDFLALSGGSPDSAQELSNNIKLAQSILDASKGQLPELLAAPEKPVKPLTLEEDCIRHHVRRLVSAVEYLQGSVKLKVIRGVTDDNIRLILTELDNATAHANKQTRGDFNRLLKRLTDAGDTTTFVETQQVLIAGREQRGPLDHVLIGSGLGNMSDDMLSSFGHVAETVLKISKRTLAEQMALEVIDGRVCCLREKLGDEWVKAHSGDITLTSEEAKAAGEKWVAATNAANFDSRYRGWYDAMLEGFGLAETQMALQRQIRELTKNMGPDTLEYHLITIGSTPPFGTQQR